MGFNCSSYCYLDFSLNSHSFCKRWKWMHIHVVCHLTSSVSGRHLNTSLLSNLGKVMLLLLLSVGIMFMLLAGLLPRPIPCSSFKTNISQVNSSVTEGNHTFLGPVV